MFNQDNNGSNNSSIYSKFRERLRNIRLLRIKKLNASKTTSIDSKIGSKENTNNKTSNNDIFINDVVKNIRATSNDRNYGRRVVMGKSNDTKAKENDKDITFNVVTNPNPNNKIA